MEELICFFGFWIITAGITIVFLIPALILSYFKQEPKKKPLNKITLKDQKEIK